MSLILIVNSRFILCTILQVNLMIVCTFLCYFGNFFVTRYNTARQAVMSDVHFRHKMFSILDVPTP